MSVKFCAMTPSGRVGGITPFKYPDASGTEREALQVGFYVSGWNGQEKTSTRLPVVVFSQPGRDLVAIFKQFYGGEENKGRVVQLELQPSVREVNRKVDVELTTDQLQTFLDYAKAHGNKATIMVPVSYTTVGLIATDFQPLDAPRSTQPEKTSGTSASNVQLKETGTSPADPTPVPVPTSDDVPF